MDDSQSPSRSWLERLALVLNGEPKDREELLEILKTAQQNSLINPDVLSMLEGVLQVSEMQVRDIMIPRSQMAVLEHDATLNEILDVVIDTTHSRYPVVGDDRDDVEGVLLAKDLLLLLRDQSRTELNSRFDLKDILRPAVIVPESKRLDVLLKEFRVNRNHMAIVVDEYGTVAGLLTIEDVLEQIVGEIEDEFDFGDEDDFIKVHADQEYIIKAHTPIEDFNAFFEAHLNEEDFDTLGGLITQALGHVPSKGEQVLLEGFEFNVVAADTRRVKLLRMKIIPALLEQEAS